jgi:hypothetical protein
MVIKCPRCGGWGHMNDGNSEYGPGGGRVLRPSSKCLMCDGKKAVFVRPATEGEAAVAMTAAHILDVGFGGE